MLFLRSVFASEMFWGTYSLLFSPPPPLPLPGRALRQYRDPGADKRGGWFEAHPSAPSLTPVKLKQNKSFKAKMCQGKRNKLDTYQCLHIFACFACVDDISAKHTDAARIKFGSHSGPPPSQAFCIADFTPFQVVHPKVVEDRKRAS